MKEKHWLLISIDKNNIRKLLEDKDFDVKQLWHGTQPYINHVIIKRLAGSIDDIDMALNKATFESDAIDK